MKSLLILLYVLPVCCLAQSNYVVNRPNSLIPGTRNTLVGNGAGNSSMTGTFKVFLGFMAGQSNTTSNAYTFMGSFSGAANTTGGTNLFVGYGSGSVNTFGSHYVFLGYSTGKSNTTGTYNSLVGLQAGEANKSDFNNSFLAVFAVQANVTGLANIFIGAGNVHGNQAVKANTMLGCGSGYTEADSNIFVGYVAVNVTTNNKGNTFLCNRGGLANSSGVHNTFIGNRADATKQDLMNATARVTIGNAIILGDSVVGTKVVTGITAPNFPLNIKKTINIRVNGTVKFSQLTNPNLRNGYIDQFLTVNEEGRNNTGSYQAAYREAIRLRRRGV